MVALPTPWWNQFQHPWDSGGLSNFLAGSALGGARTTHRNRCSLISSPRATSQICSAPDRPMLAKQRNTTLPSGCASSHATHSSSPLGRPHLPGGAHFPVTTASTARRIPSELHDGHNICIPPSLLHVESGGDTRSTCKRTADGGEEGGEGLRRRPRRSSPLLTMDSGGKIGVRAVRSPLFFCFVRWEKRRQEEERRK
ncbi:hypothetical protein PR202_ga31418 [Eleusine coracana subsp. coracana]|uniref:Uncharacterized protein n=1 Tax=Eleusine coracana subsp. coracana TaxID=191504 RepID=A0AAV5DS06_ELECO|nr:hypothetical protein PR202_ga31418 [Eleusine coracana subsp. coracana]